MNTFAAHRRAEAVARALTTHASALRPIVAAFVGASKTEHRVDPHCPTLTLCGREAARTGPLKVDAHRCASCDQIAAHNLRDREPAFSVNVYQACDHRSLTHHQFWTRADAERFAATVPTFAGAPPSHGLVQDGRRLTLIRY